MNLSRSRVSLLLERAVLVLLWAQAYDFLIAVAEPQCRPEAVHEYLLSQHSLYAAVSIGLSTETIISVLNRLSKVELAPQVCQFIQDSTENFGKVRF
jgi:DNA excision repair protein ERCC-3